ncbi:MULTISPECIES: four-helix bundle copper-binding protein [Microbacterium]|jgi:hypothetical protein|uniref:four-helix bundle copper-binding protein n=1 Tax=Microbacterium TaxID=33882 RepID=UPI00076A6133|nr:MULTISPECIES: four-helix bundle copper-binding protein [Microbacterium]MCT2223801.1 four-helix bundle copper-binding protein [Microbacterium paraoxydans]
MTVTAQMIDTHPRPLDGPARDALLACIDACLECGQACTACADACLSEEMVAELTTCIRINQDCADLCDATARILSRRTTPDTTILRATLEALRAACTACAAECDAHADMHEHCRVCAEACRRCEQACTDLLATL